jgi:hypothetical protein
MRACVSACTKIFNGAIGQIVRNSNLNIRMHVIARSKDFIFFHYELF